MLSLIYGVVSYGVFLASFLYAVGFVENVVVPKSIDSGEAVPFAQALIVNALLLGAFALQHSGMARRGFKRVLTRVVPKPIERSTYVLATCLVLIQMFALWRPLPQTIWSVESPVGQYALYALSALGWLTVLVATFLVSHWDLFGLRQVILHWKGTPYREVGFRTPALYKLVRHPIYMGFLTAFWATPHMTAGHLMFAVMTTGYILTGIYLEERDLVYQHGDRYLEYRKQVRMLLPVPKPAPGSRERAVGA